MSLAIALEPVVLVVHDGRRFVFRVDHRPPLAFWRVDVGRRSYPLAIRVTGDEQPLFFERLAAQLALQAF